jgi:hypothetical protein
MPLPLGWWLLVFDENKRQPHWLLQSISQIVVAIEDVVFLCRTWLSRPRRLQSKQRGLPSSTTFHHDWQGPVAEWTRRLARTRGVHHKEQNSRTGILDSSKISPTIRTPASAATCPAEREETSGNASQRNHPRDWPQKAPRAEMEVKI